MKRPINVILGAAILIAQSALSAFFLCMDLFTSFPLPDIAQLFLVSGTYGGPVTMLTAIGLAFAVLSLSYVFQGDESGRSLFLIWTTSSLVLGLSFAADPSAVVVDTFLGILVLFLWFTPDASEFFSADKDVQFASV